MTFALWLAFFIVFIVAVIVLAIFTVKAKPYVDEHEEITSYENRDYYDF